MLCTNGYKAKIAVTLLGLNVNTVEIENDKKTTVNNKIDIDW